MMITSPVHAGIRATAGPAECLRPVFVQFCFVAPELFLEFLAHIVCLLDQDMAPARLFLLADPGYELQLSFVEAPVAAYATL